MNRLFRKRGKVVTDIDNVMRLTMLANIQAPPVLMMLARAVWSDNSMPDRDWKRYDAPAQSRMTARRRIGAFKPTPILLQRQAS